MIYSYTCLSCPHEFDVVKKLADIDRIERCSACQSADTKRRICAPGFTDSVSLGLVKPPQEWRDMLKTIHKQTPGSQIKVD